MFPGATIRRGINKLYSLGYLADQADRMIVKGAEAAEETAGGVVGRRGDQTLLERFIVASRLLQIDAHLVDVRVGGTGGVDFSNGGANGVAEIM